MAAVVERRSNMTDVPCGAHGLLVMTTVKTVYEHGVIEWTANLTLYPWDADERTDGGQD